MSCGDTIFAWDTRVSGWRTGRDTSRFGLADGSGHHWYLARSAQFFECFLRKVVERDEFGTIDDTRGRPEVREKHLLAVFLAPGRTPSDREGGQV